MRAKEEPLRRGSVLARRAFFITLVVGLLEVIVGRLSLSIALVADGIHSVAIATVFLIVWIGLHLSGRAPDGTFHFGYYRFENLGSLLAAFVMVFVGGLLVYESYLVSLQPRLIINPLVVMATALASMVVATVVSILVERTSRKYGIASLRTGVLNGVVDAISSFAVFFTALLNAYFGLLHADAVAGILIALAIFVAAYSIIKEASLVLLDACHCGDLVEFVGEIARDVKGIKQVHSVRLRRLGSYMVGDMHIVVDSNLAVREADQIATQVEEKVRKEVKGLIEFKIRIESDEAHAFHAKEFTVKVGPSKKK